MHSMLYIPNVYDTLRCILFFYCIVHLMQYSTMILSYTKYMIHVDILNTSPNECTCPIKHSHRTGVYRCVYIIVQHWCISTSHCKLVSMYINYYLICLLRCWDNFSRRVSEFQIGVCCYCEVSVLRVITHVVSVYTLTCICPLGQNYRNVYVLLSLGCSQAMHNITDRPPLTSHIICKQLIYCYPNG